MAIKKPLPSALLPPLLAPYPTLCGLYRQLSETPLEETVRLAFADALSEAADEGGPGALDLGDLCSLLRLESERPEKSPPLRFTRADLRPKGGPNYYEFTASDDDSLEVGQRVDVIPDSRMPNPPPPLYSGRVVSVGSGGWPGERLVTVCRDEKSGVDLTSLWRSYAARRDGLIRVAVGLLPAKQYSLPPASFLYPWASRKLDAEFPLFSSSLALLEPDSPLTNVPFSNTLMLRLCYYRGFFSGLELPAAQLFPFSVYFGALPISWVRLDPGPDIECFPPVHTADSYRFVARFGGPTLEYRCSTATAADKPRDLAVKGLVQALSAAFPQVGDWQTSGAAVYFDSDGRR